jgi:hypothetical protein
MTQPIPAIPIILTHYQQRSDRLLNKYNHGEYGRNMTMSAFDVVWDEIDKVTDWYIRRYGYEIRIPN